MSLLQSFIALFESLNMLVTCLWITGLVLFCIEFFQPMHGVAYALGLALMGAAFTVHMLHGSAGEAFMFIFLTSVFLFLVHVVSLFTQKRDWLRVARIERAGERRRKYDSLIGSIGVANTPVDLMGNATINNINLVVYSDTPIPKGERVRITGITHDRITVARADDIDA